jgi:hypothetical protein
MIFHDVIPLIEHSKIYLFIPNHQQCYQDMFDWIMFLMKQGKDQGKPICLEHNYSSYHIPKVTFNLFLSYILILIIYHSIFI